MHLLLPLLSLFNFIGGALFGRFIGSRGVKGRTVGVFVASFVFWLFLPVNVVVTLKQWLVWGVYSINITRHYDVLAMVMVAIILIVSFSVHVYSFYYRSEDPHFIRFVSFLSLFTFFRLVLVTAGDLVQLFVGWEGVGFMSYLLISFWYTRVAAAKAAFKAILRNKVGDVGRLIALVLILISFKTSDIVLINGLSGSRLATSVVIGGYSAPLLTVIGCLLLLGVVAKSAQIGLHGWLTDAMEGPTPVSALLHAATMVTAGIYLVLRLSFRFDNVVRQLRLLVAIFTVVIANSLILNEYDIKKIIALSTCAHLGLRLRFCGLGAFKLAFFHLFNHAFSKALLFRGAGNVIHAAVDEQDIRRLIGFKNFLPVTIVRFYSSVLSLLGTPFLANFYSKDRIFEIPLVSSFVLSSAFVFWLRMTRTFVTTIRYSYKLLSIFNVPAYIPAGVGVSFYRRMSGSAERSVGRFIGLRPLLLCSMGGGYFRCDYLMGIGHNNMVWVKEMDCGGFGLYEYFPFYLKIIPVLVTVVMGVGVFIVEGVVGEKLWGRGFVWPGVRINWYSGEFYNRRLRVGMCVSNGVRKTLDRGVLEYLVGRVVNGIGTVHNLLRQLNVGSIRNYSFVLVWAVVCSVRIVVLLGIVS